MNSAISFAVIRVPPLPAVSPPTWLRSRTRRNAGAGAGRDCTRPDRPD